MISELLQHPLSAAFPAMQESEIQALAEDIKKHGQREKGVVFEGRVLDGWHRFLACRQAGVQFAFSEYDGDDPVAFVLSRNLHRRHLTASQRAAAIVAAGNWRPQGVTVRAAPGAGLTEKQMADAAEVSERTIRDAKAAHKAGLGEAMRDGMMSAKEAAQVASGKAPKKEKQPDTDPRDAQILELQQRLDAVLEEKDEIAQTARELEDKLTAFETTDPDEQQKEIQKLQKRIVKLEAEVERMTRARNDAQAKCNELIREVKRLRKRG